MTREELYQEIEKLGPEGSAGERMMKYFTGQEADCQPYATMIFDWAMAKMWGYKKSDFNDFEKKCEILRRKKDEYGMDSYSVSLGLRTMGEALGSKVYYPEDGMEYITEHVMKDYAMLDELENYDVRNNKFLMDMIEDAKRVKEAIPEIVLATSTVGPMSTASSIRSVELLLRDVRKNPEKLHKLLDFCVDASLQWLRIFSEETGCKQMSIADPVTSTDVLGKKYFEEFSKPYFKRLFDGVTEICDGAKPMVHICGHTKGIWEDLAEVGVQAFSIDNCEDIVEAREILGNRMMLVGNVSPVSVMRKGTIDEIIEAVKDHLRKAAESPCGYMIAPGCEVPAGTPKENLDAFIYAVRKYGAGAKLGCLPKGLQEA